MAREDTLFFASMAIAFHKAVFGDGYTSMKIPHKRNLDLPFNVFLLPIGTSGWIKTPYMNASKYMSI
jgi:hypothetical protein